VKFLSEKVLSRENDRVRDQVLAEIRFGGRASDDGRGVRIVRDQRPWRPRPVEGRARASQGGAQDALQQTALWQQVLNDGIADLTADVDHDLRGRFRAISQHTEHVIDNTDPTHHWAEIGAELEHLDRLEAGRDNRPPLLMAQRMAR